MKKSFLILFVCFSALSIFAGSPPRHHGHGRPDGRYWGPPPPGYYYRGGYYYRNDSVRLAADIVGLVGTSLNILNPPRPVVVTPSVIIPSQQPVIVEQPSQRIIIQQRNENLVPIYNSNGQIIGYKKVE